MGDADDDEFPPARLMPSARGIRKIEDYLSVAGTAFNCH